MRCLYCNKKLSLLKLAKGDSFCSPDHFDAHQLQLSKDAFERLKSLPDEDSPKTPLAVGSSRNDAPLFRSGEEDAALTRMTEFSAPPQPPPLLPTSTETPAFFESGKSELEEENSAVARLKAFSPPPAPQGKTAQDPPPYAPFASSPPEFCSMAEGFPIANGLESTEPVEGPRELAFPVHDVAVTVAILNLYLRLSLAGNEPKNWTSPRHLIVTPEDFHLQIERPALGLSPEFPDIEDLAPVELAPRMEAVPPAAIAPPVEALPVVENVPLPKPVILVDRASLAPIEPAEPRLPFLLAPSFRERAGTPIILHTAASSMPDAANLAPVLDKGKLARIDSCWAFPSFTCFSATTAFPAPESKVGWIESAAQFSGTPACSFPDAKQQMCEDAWSPSSRQMAVDRPPLEGGSNPVSALDFNAPAPASLVVLPEAWHLRKANPQELLGGTPGWNPTALFLGVLETQPFGQAPLVVSRPVSAIDLGWVAAFAPAPGWKPLAAAWQYRSSYGSLRAPVLARFDLPRPPLEPLPYGPAPAGANRAHSAVLPAPYVATVLYRPAAWAETDSPSAPLPAELGLVFSGSTQLPRSMAVPAGSLKTGAGAPALTWEPGVPPPEHPPAAKFLPIRDVVRLPAARSWPRLTVLPR